MKHVSKSLITLAVSLVTFLLFAFAVQPIPHAGESAFILAQKLGVDPFPSFSSPVYGWVVGAISLVFGSSAIWAINLFSALCAAGVLGLVFAFVYRVTRLFNVDNAMPAARMHRAQVFSGLTSVLYLLAATPFWMAATRANPLTFDLLLLLSCFYLIVSFTGKNDHARPLFATLLYGVTIVQFSTAILVAPFFVLLLLSRLWYVGTLTSRVLGQLLLCGLLGMSLYLVQAGFYMATPAYEWREFRDFFQVIWYIWLEQYHGLTGGLPRQGWLTLALVSLLPWAITTGFRIPSGPNRARGAVFGTGALNAILGVLAILLLRDFPLAPANLTGTTRLFVTPYVLIALWVGNVMIFWMVVSFRQKRFEQPWQLKSRRALGSLLAVAIPVVLLGFMVLQAMPRSRNPADHLVQEFAEAVVDAAADKEWLVSNTMIDDQIGLEIHRRRLPLKMVRMGYGRSTALMKYVAHQFSDNPRLESLARIGMEPLMDQWFINVTDPEKNIAVVTVPDLWLAAGLEAVPQRVLFTGARLDEALALDALLQSHRDFWNDYGQRLVALDSDDSPGGVMLTWIRVHLSKIANNFGVMLEDKGRSDEAFECYQRARELAPDNLSALMNLHVLAQRETRPEFEALEKELIERTENLMGKIQAFSLSYVYGFVRVPELFANRGMTFAMSGKASMAISEMKRALALGGGNSRLELALAGLYFAQDKDAESRESYENVLARQPDNVQALAGLMRLSARQGDFIEARRILQVLKDAGANPTALKFEEAMVESLAGAPAKGLRLLREVVREQPENIQAWAALASLASELNETSVAEQALKKLQEAKSLTPNIQLIMAQSALTQQDIDGARRHLNDILRRQSGHVQALEMLLRIDMNQGSRDQIIKTTERILRHDPRNALANYMLGVHHYINEEFALAESAYRASVATRRSGEALNDLAYVLYLQNKRIEAEVFVRESLEINDRNSAAWDTLGVILMDNRKLEEAEEALLKSLSLRPDTASVVLSLAILYEKQGRLEDAARIARDINARLNELSPQSQSTLRALVGRLDDPQ